MFNQENVIVEMDDGLSAYVTKIFLWMFAGLLIIPLSELLLKLTKKSKLFHIT